MKKIYVGCSLTHAPAEFKANVEILKEALRQKYEVLDFLGMTNGTEQEVYDWDIHTCIATCDILLAVCDLPSLGLGYEMGTAIEKLGTPTLAVAHTDAKVARLILGIHAPNFRLERYTNMEEIPALLEAFERDII